MKSTLLTLVAALSLAGGALAGQTPGHKVLVLKNKDGAAILGYDAVACFTDNKAVKGNPKFESEYEGARYYFASADHKKLFDANPAKYAPAYNWACQCHHSIGIWTSSMTFPGWNRSDASFNTTKNLPRRHQMVSNVPVETTSVRINRRRVFRRTT